MLNPDFFSTLGMMVVREFLDRETCVRLRRQVRLARQAPAGVWTDGADQVDEDSRRTTHARVPKRVAATVERRLLALRPQVERHFGVSLSGIQKPQFLVYRRGDFFQCHVDDNPDADAPDYMRERRVSAVLFLNGEGKRGRKDVSGGGGLTFPGLIDDRRLKSHWFHVRGEAGLLIAFRSNVAHAVAPVSHGARYTVVTWYV